MLLKSLQSDLTVYIIEFDPASFQESHAEKRVATGRPCGYSNLVGTSEPIHSRLIDIGNDDALISKCHGNGPEEWQVPGSDPVLRQIQKITEAGVDNKIMPAIRF